jgi:hypothetical protein
MDKKENEYMVYLRYEYDKNCKSSDKTIEETAHRNVCEDMFNGLTYVVNEFKLNKLRDVIEKYQIVKNGTPISYKNNK